MDRDVRLHHEGEACRRLDEVDQAAAQWKGHAQLVGLDSLDVLDAQVYNVN